MTPWHLRKRLRGWIVTQLIGFDPEALVADNPPDAPPLEPDENVTAVDDDTPTIGDEGRSMIVGVGPAGRQPVAKLEPSTEVKPLVGSVEERLARYRLR